MAVDITTSSTPFSEERIREMWEKLEPERVKSFRAVTEAVQQASLPPPALQAHSWQREEGQLWWRCGGPIITVFAHTGPECAGCGEVVTLEEVNTAFPNRQPGDSIAPWCDLVVAKRRLAA